MMANVTGSGNGPVSAMSPADVIAGLRPHLSEERFQRMQAVVAGRTRTVVPVLQGLVNWGNICAVMRSAEALGYLDFHIVSDNRFEKVSGRTTQGADRWLDIHRWEAAGPCVASLREAGYTIIAMHADEGSEDVSAIDFTRRTALVFGNEQEGVSGEMLGLADRHCIIPMSGFTRSFNVSVAAALALHHAQEDRLRRMGRHGDLPAAEQERLLADYMIRGVEAAELILERIVGGYRP